jgi:integrase
MCHEDPRLFRRRRKDGSLSPVWYGWFYDATGKQICKSTKRTDRRAATRVRAGWERDAAEPGRAAARDAVLLDAIELLLQARKEQVSAGRKSEATFGFYREKTGHWLRVLGEGFPLAQLSATDVDRYITYRRSEWSVPPREPVLGPEGNVLRPARAGRHVTDHTIAKEIVALRAALKPAKRRGIWKGDPAEVLPVGFAPDYKPRERFLTCDELEALLGELLEDAAARVAFTVATSAEAAATERAMREDVSPDRRFVQVRGSKRATRWLKVPIVASWQRDLLDFALEHAQGRDGWLFLPRTKFGQTLARACDRAEIARCTPNDLRRTYSTWLRADGVPNELSAPTMGHKDTRMLDRVYARLPPELLRLRLLHALGRCSAGAVNTTDGGAQNGRAGQSGDEVTAGEVAPRRTSI